MRPLPVLPDTWPLAEKALFATLAALDVHQPPTRATGGVHAAALCSADGAIRLVRANVRLHNRFALPTVPKVRQGLARHGGSALLASQGRQKAGVGKRGADS